jgi:hypothetical protein
VLRLTLCVLVLALAIPAVAIAARRPTQAERTAITRVMTTTDVPRSCFPLDIEVSTRNSRYAAATYRSTNACGIVVGNGTSILRRVGYRRWRIVETGSAFDCDADRRIPASVMRDVLSYC